MSVQRFLPVLLAVGFVLLVVAVGPGRASMAQVRSLPAASVGDGAVPTASGLSAPRYQVETGTISGGGYRLTSSGTQGDTVAAGGAYRLLMPSAPTLHGSGCCCSYLPCLMRNP